MSDASHGSEAHVPHVHEVFEGKPADSIPPDEPHTPGWLPIVGAVLVLCGIMAFALTRSGQDEDPQAPSAAAAAVEPAPSAAPPAAERPQRPERPAPPQAMPAGSLPVRLTPLPSGMRPVRRPPPPGGAMPGAEPRPAP